MKTRIFLSLLLIAVTGRTVAQMNGSGTIVSKSYGYKDFDKVSLTDLNGSIAIEIGKAWSVNCSIDDNLQKLLQVDFDQTEHRLKISFKDNPDNKLYIENTHINIKITMPEISVLTHSGNSEVKLSNVTGSYLKIENSSNGNVTASGKIDSLDIVHSGNGDVNAQRLSCKKAMVESSGNGDVLISTDENLQANGSGNGHIINTGRAAFSKTSFKDGNGKLIKK
jgi:hypothetical protein